MKEFLFKAWLKLLSARCVIITASTAEILPSAIISVRCLDSVSGEKKFAIFPPATFDRFVEVVKPLLQDKEYDAVIFDKTHQYKIYIQPIKLW